MNDKKTCEEILAEEEQARKELMEQLERKRHKEELIESEGNKNESDNTERGI